MGLLTKGIALERNLISKGQPLIGKLNTDIDRLYYMVKSSGVVSLSKACKTLGVQRKQIEEYATILANQSLIRIRRPLLGDVIFESLEQLNNPKKQIMLGVLLWNASL